MQIFVQSLSSGKSIPLSVQPHDSIPHVQDCIYHLEGVPPAEQRLVSSGGKHLHVLHHDDNDQCMRTLEDYGIGPDSTLVLNLRIRGGHCQVPCGIFDDPAMVAELKEAAATIRKSIVQATDLHASSHSNLLSMNQLFRWIQTKEQHADKIIDKVSTYGLCQRVKKEIFKTDADYVEALKAHHAVMQCAMKCKQSATVDACDALDAALIAMAPMYLPS